MIKRHNHNHKDLQHIQESIYSVTLKERTQFSHVSKTWSHSDTEDNLCS